MRTIDVIPQSMRVDREGNGDYLFDVEWTCPDCGRSRVNELEVSPLHFPELLRKIPAQLVCDCGFVEVVAFMVNLSVRAVEAETHVPFSLEPVCDVTLNDAVRGFLREVKLGIGRYTIPPALTPHIKAMRTLISRTENTVPAGVAGEPSLTPQVMVHRLGVHITEEQNRMQPDTSLIGTLFECIRLLREKR